MKPWTGQLLLGLALLGVGKFAFADTITFQGTISQSTSDGTGPAVNNMSLNSIADGDSYIVTLIFTGSITSPGTYPLSGATVLFNDTTAGVTESDFGDPSISVSTNVGFDDISFLGCLNSGSGCMTGNYLSANFEIDGTKLNSQNVPASTIFGLSPAMDLLEDDGVTDIQGDVSLYSYSGSTSAAPEPSAIWAACAGLLAMAGVRRFRAARSA
jgi:hypothetical protein